MDGNRQQANIHMILLRISWGSRLRLYEAMFQSHTQDGDSAQYWRKLNMLTVSDFF